MIDMSFFVSMFDILILFSDLNLMNGVKKKISITFDVKDLGEANLILVKKINPNY